MAPRMGSRKYKMSDRADYVRFDLSVRSSTNNTFDHKALLLKQYK